MTDESITWKTHLFNSKIVHFERANGWQSITNFGEKPVSLPKGEVVLTSQPLVGGKLGPNTTAWIVGVPAKLTSDDGTLITIGAAAAMFDSSVDAGGAVDGGGFGDGGAIIHTAA